MDSMTHTNPHATDRTSIHPTALVAHGAELGPGVQIGPFCTVGPNVVIEAGAKLVSHVVV
jgi:UDP-N-acetylglucosamine acyltransferase